MKNWMTSVCGFLAGVPMMLTAGGVTIAPGSKAAVALGVLQGVGAIGLGLAAKDFNKTGAK